VNDVTNLSLNPTTLSFSPAIPTRSAAAPAAQPSPAVAGDRVDLAAAPKPKKTPRTKSSGTKQGKSTNQTGTAKFSYNPKDPLTMPSETYTVHGLIPGAEPSTDKTKLNDPLSPNADGNYVFADGDKSFTPSAAFASVNHTVDLFWKGYGEKKWAFGSPQLGVNSEVHVDNPNPLANMNAFYQRQTGSVNYFWGTDPVTNQRVEAGRAGDITGHEVGHALLDGLRPGYFLTLSPDPKAFHESFGDVTAFLGCMQDDSVIKKVVEQTGGDLSKTNIASESAKELAQAINDAVGKNVTGGAFLRNMDNDLKWADPKTLDKNPSDPKQLGWEAHNFSRVWSGAFYDVFTGMVDQNIKGGMDPATALKQASTDGIASYGALFKPGYAPEGGFTYKDMANAWIKSDKDHNNGKLAGLIENAMEKRDILPKTESLVAGTQAQLLPSGTRSFSAAVAPQDGIPAAFVGAKATTMLSGDASKGIFEDAQDGINLQSDMARLIKAGDVLIRQPGATGAPSPQELSKPDGSGFYAAYMETVDGQKTIVQSQIVD
jgi:hypothetical protein